MSLFGSLGKLVGGVVKGAVGLATAPLKIAANVANNIFGGGEQQCGPGPQGPSIFGCGPRPFPHHHHHHLHGPHGHHHHGPHMPPPPQNGGGIHFHFDS